MFLQNTKRIPLSFQSFPGLAINYSKSGLIVLGKDEALATEIAKNLGCTLVQLLITSLGVSLGESMKKFNSRLCVIEKIQHMLNSWKGTCLSRARRVVLIKVVLNSIPVYYLSIFNPRR